MGRTGAGSRKRKQRSSAQETGAMEKVEHVRTVRKNR